MHKYLYLEKTSWADTWIKGGNVPLKLASTYLSAERSGTSTPDENLIYDSPIDINSLSGICIGNVKNLTIGSFVIDGKFTPGVKDVSMYHEDGVVLCLSNRFDLGICKKLGKSVCVKITDIDKLKQSLDRQIGLVGLAGACKYTDDHRRNHFLKSGRDRWQDEYRLFWKIKNSVEVDIPAGIAELVDLA